MLSRLANSIYWMSRYLERADNIARFIDVNLHLILDFDMNNELSLWQPLITTSGDDADFKQRYHDVNEENVLRFLTFDNDNPNSILSCISMARENARGLRDIISSEIWEIINRSYLLVQKNSRKRTLTNLREFYEEIKRTNYMLIGLFNSTVSYNEAWQFAHLGRFIERADKTARILDVKYFLLLPKVEYVDTPYDLVQWGALLKSVSAFEMYRKQYHGIDVKQILHFLIFDAAFPRSLNLCIQEMQRAMHAISQLNNKTSQAIIEIQKLHHMLNDTNIDYIINNGVHEFIDVFQLNLNIVDREIYHSFFAIEA